MTAKKIHSLFLEGIFFGISGTVFTVLIFLMQDSLTRPPSTGDIIFPDDSVKITIGLAWLILGLSISAVFWNIVFKKQTNDSFLKWFLILISSSITPVLMQMAFLIYVDNNSRKHPIGYFWELLGAEWMVKLFLILVPFTFLFANRHSIIEKIQNRRNSLK